MKKTREHWEKEFIVSFIGFREYLLGEEPLSILGPKRADALNSIINAYFIRRRHCIPEASYFMNCEDAAIFINDVVISYISDEYPGFLDVDWQEKFILKSEIDEEEESDNDYDIY